MQKSNRSLEQSKLLESWRNGSDWIKKWSTKEGRNFRLRLNKQPACLLVRKITRRGDDYSRPSRKLCRILKLIGNQLTASIVFKMFWIDSRVAWSQNLGSRKLEKYLLWQLDRCWKANRGKERLEQPRFIKIVRSGTRTWQTASRFRRRRETSKRRDWKASQRTLRNRKIRDIVLVWLQHIRAKSAKIARKQILHAFENHFSLEVTLESWKDFYYHR